MKIRVLIVDDEPLARQRVRLLLGEEPDVEVIGESTDGFEALDQLQSAKPDLVFLDVQMPDMDGFEVLRQTPQALLPVVIFTTAYDQHALQAFEANALDYLLKPFKPARFAEAVQRARALIADKHAGLAINQARGLLTLLGQSSAPPPVAGGGRILVRSSERILFLKPGEIDRVEAAGNYVVLHSGKEQHILRETISSMEARLAPAGFMRISRSVIVNLACIREIQSVASGRYSLLLKNGIRLDMTCTLAELQARLGEI
jgi:two-component system LytT family response regulator